MHSKAKNNTKQLTVDDLAQVTGGAISIEDEDGTETATPDGKKRAPGSKQRITS